ncbi:MAG: DNA primase DnaG, partial [Candidatus Thorarchaeota archaeon]
MDKPDVIGALFGQTEGLIGEDMDLRELQRTGRVGRIQIAIKSEAGVSRGEIVIPVSLNRTATAMLAAAIETVDRVGPCTARVTLEKLEDIRGAKRRRVVSRAISILKGWGEEVAPDTERITGEVTKASRKMVTKYGPDKLPAGPDLMGSNEIIIVEGRADVVNLMRNGFDNTIALEGTHVPATIIDLTKNTDKTIVAFLDGDRGGDLILRELMQVARVDYISRAPEGKEVEELTRREITKALQTRIPAEQALALLSEKHASPVAQKRNASKRVQERKRNSETEGQRGFPPRRPVDEFPGPRPHSRGPKQVVSIDEVYVRRAATIKETLKAVLFDTNGQEIAECSVADLAKVMESYDTVGAVVFD